MDVGDMPCVGQYSLTVRKKGGRPGFWNRCPLPTAGPRRAIVWPGQSRPGCGNLSPGFWIPESWIPKP